MSVLLAAGCTTVVLPMRSQPDVRGAPRSQDASSRTQDEPGPGAPRTEVYGGLGITADPRSFLLSGGVDFPVGDAWTVGPLVQLGIDDDQTLFAPSANAKKLFRVENEPRLRPFAQAGIGFAYIDRKRRAGDDDDLGPLLNVGGGLRFELDERTSIGSGLLFNVLPADVAGEHFYVSWDIVQVVFRL